MTISIEIPPEIEQELRRRAEALGEDLATYVRQVVTESVNETVDPPKPKRSAEEFARRLDAWTALHPVLDHAIDDSRESIYEGRGE